MGRWEPDAAGRLRAAAMDLYVEQGYEQTTVAEIAEKAGLTARTFFRHFADKREVLFGGSEMLEQEMVAALEAAPADAGPMAAVSAALAAAADFVGGNRAHSRRRQDVISANAELRERDLIKMATLGDALAGALVRRGVDLVEARLAAEAGVAVFRTAFEQWLASGERRDLAAVIQDSFDRLRGLTAS